MVVVEQGSMRTRVGPREQKSYLRLGLTPRGRERGTLPRKAHPTRIASEGPPRLHRWGWP